MERFVLGDPLVPLCFHRRTLSQPGARSLCTRIFVTSYSVNIPFPEPGSNPARSINRDFAPVSLIR